MGEAKVPRNTGELMSRVGMMGEKQYLLGRSGPGEFLAESAVLEAEMRKDDANMEFVAELETRLLLAAKALPPLVWRELTTWVRGLADIGTQVGGVTRGDLLYTESLLAERYLTSISEARETLAEEGRAIGQAAALRTACRSLYELNRFLDRWKEEQGLTELEFSYRYDSENFFLTIRSGGLCADRQLPQCVLDQVEFPENVLLQILTEMLSSLAPEQ